MKIQTILELGALLGLLPLLAGCGAKQTDSVSAGGAVIKRAPAYKGQDKELVERSNSIPVYSTPDSARRVLQRHPDQVVTEGNGVVTHYYDSDRTATSERLRLRYSDGHLIGKEIVPPDVNAAPPASRTAGLPAKQDPNASFNASFNQQINARQ